MAQAHVFGYGSLMAAGAGTPCRLAGHRRRLGVAMDNRRTIPGYKYYVDPAGGRPPVFVAFLDLVPDPAASVLGLVFPVADGDLDALDARERNYRRVDVREAIDADLGGPVWAYLGLDDARERYERAAREGAAVVARAYLDGVRDGFASVGLGFESDPVEVPVMDLTRVDVPAGGDV